MPFIKPTRQAVMKQLTGGETASVFDRLLANDPDTYESFLPLQKAIKQTSISDELREAVITFVSMKNGCEYCTNSHAEVLGNYLDKDDVLPWLADYSNSSMNKDWQTVLTYAEHLISKPVSVTKEDIEGLRSYGYDEKKIVELVQVIAYTSYTNQLSIGLGL